MGKFLTGVLAGVAIGLLVAPDKGSKTRQKITDALNDLLGEAKDRVNSSAEQFRDQFNGSDDTFTNDIDRPVAKISTDF
jgi:gas vesicle protein